MKKLQGIIPPMITPLKGDDELDRGGIARLVEHMLGGGVHGLFLLGTACKRVRDKFVRSGCPGYLVGLFSVAVLVFLGACGRAVDGAKAVADLIPVPTHVDLKSGSFELSGTLHVSCADSTLLPAVDFLTELLPAGFSATGSCEAGGEMLIALDSALAADGTYRLEVAPRRIRLSAGSYGGAIAGIATLGQLVSSDGCIPVLSIEDSPRFAWRGFMLDVARHFFTKEEVKALLFKMAQYKFNKFHWHLTDDQGWRIEIRRFPELTGQGAWRDPATHNHDVRCRALADETRDESFRLPAENLRMSEGRELYGGYYTQDDIREVVAYAAALGIDVIPELDMPGHSLQVVACHPELSCRGKAEWGETFSTPLCLGNDATLAFCKQVYEEVFELFPFGYVHLGADEVEKTNWTHCPRCQRRIALEGLADENGLQAWFVREMEAFFDAHGRRLIGWDEITAGGVSQTAVVQWWRSWLPDTLVASVQNGNDVILSPVEFTYLSEQNRRSLSKVYNYEPLEGLPDSARDRVLGVHTNLWTEYVPSFDRACYHIFPRFFAISEIAWCQPGQKDLSSFLRRANVHLARLNDAGWNGRMPDLEGFCDRNVFVDSTIVRLRKPVDDLVVRFTSDGSVPDASSPVLPDSLCVRDDCVLKFRTFTASGVPGTIAEAAFCRDTYRDAVTVDAPLHDGLTTTWYDYRGQRCAEIDRAPFKGRFSTPDVRIPEGVHGNIGLVIEGYLSVPADGIYSFYTYTDDGSLLKIDGEVVVDNDGAHSRTERSGQAALRKGLHELEIRYFDSNGGILEAGTIDSAGLRRPFDGDMLKHR